MPDRDLPAFDCYRALGVPVTATTAEIEVAFRIAAKREHPDLSPDPATATIRMQRLNVARAWLTDPARRSRYDAARGVRPLGPVGGISDPEVDLPDVDPLGAWAMDPIRHERRGSQVGPIMASIALMVLITMIFLGTSSLVTAAIAVAAMIVLLLGVVVTILGATR